MDNLEIIVPYHDLTKIDFEQIKENVLKITDNVRLINNNFNRSEWSQEILDRFGHLKGCKLDEFNAQSYFVDELNGGDKNSEYVYNCQYRRFLDVPDDLKLEKDAIYCTKFPHKHSALINHIYYRMIYFKSKEDVIKLIDILSNIFDIPQTKIFEILKEGNYYPFEMYIMHKDLQKEMVHKIYQFIYMYCTSITDIYLMLNRCVGYAIELFVSMFINYKELQGYKIKTLPFISTCSENYY